MISNKETRKDFLDYMFKRRSGKIISYDTGYDKVNKGMPDTKGLETNKFWIIAGLSGHGKSTFVTRIEYNILKLNKNVCSLNFTLENKARKILEKNLMAEYNLTYTQLYNNSTNYDFLKDKINEVSKLDITYVEREHTVQQIEDKILSFYEQKKKEYGEDYMLLVVFDHALLTGDDGNEREVIKKLTKRFSLIRNKINCSIILLSQLNDNILTPQRLFDPSGVGHYPLHTDLFGSRTLMHDADIVTVIHRPEKLGLTKYGPRKDDCKGFTYLHNIKMRDGVESIKKLKNRLENATYD